VGEIDGLDIRKMQESDLDEVGAIEHDLFTLPWSRASFLFEIADSRTSYAIAAILQSRVVGYAVGWFVADELHIGNVAVKRLSQGKGIGRMLLEKMLAEAGTRGTTYATLEVRVSNTRAIGLYRKHGFKGVAIRKRYYSDNGEDALVMMAEAGRRNSGKLRSFGPDLDIDLGSGFGPPWQADI
jgi:ribosomal-protein-alanine N-acetyltransferase